jgi:hypothetical protein
LLCYASGQWHFGRGKKNVPSKETVAGVVDDIYRLAFLLDVQPCVLFIIMLLVIGVAIIEPVPWQEDASSRSS